MSRSSADHALNPSAGGLARWIVENPGAGWTALIGVLVWGVVSYFSLPQQEDPALPGRIARIVCVWPGASATQVEELVTRPLEERTNALDSMQETSSESREGVSVITLGQRPARPPKIEQEWDKLRATLAQVDLPAGCQPPRLLTEFGDVVTLLLAVTSSSAADYRPLTAAAAQLAEELERLPEVGRVQLIGPVDETIDLTATPDRLQQHSLSLRQTGEKLSGFGQPIPGTIMPIPGTIMPGPETNLPVRLDSGPATEEGLRALVVGSAPDGAPVRLEDVFAVRRGDPQPLPFTADVLIRQPADGVLARQRSVLVAVEMRTNKAISRFDREVSATVARIAPKLPSGVEVATVSDQPASVALRLDRFSRCFIEAVAVILLVALLLMEWRAAVIVACAIPLTVAMTLGGMAVAGSGVTCCEASRALITEGPCGRFPSDWSTARSDFSCGRIAPCSDPPCATRGRFWCSSMGCSPAA